jgi:hypothetical protein
VSDRERGLRNALRRHRAAELAIERILRTEFPPGSSLTFIGSRGIRYDATVVMNCYGDRIKVRNEHTGAERFIHAWRIHKTP